MISPAGLSPSGGYGLKVLVAEDNMTSQMVVCHHLRNLKCEVELTSSGLGAVAAWKRTTFDLILMDVNMPEMDGLQATHAIREAEKASGSHQIIYATTAMALEGDRELCMAAGMDEYVTKPIRKNELEHVLFDVAQKLGIPPRESGSESPMDKSGQLAPENIIDAGSLLEDLGGDMAFVVAMARTGSRDLTDYMAGIRLAIEEANARKLRVAAHSLKTTFGQWGASRAHALAFSIEKAGAAGNVEEGARHLSELNLETEKVGGALGDFIKANS